jgi:hypothetical protein
MTWGWFLIARRRGCGRLFPHQQKIWISFDPYSNSLKKIAPQTQKSDVTNDPRRCLQRLDKPMAGEKVMGNKQTLA